MSTSSSITPQLLEALLSPDAAVRSQAETVFHSVSVLERVQGFLSNVSATAGSSPTTLLGAVLLRRDIVKLDNISVLAELVNPLLQCYHNNVCQLQIGHCLAEICAALSSSLLASASGSDAVLNESMRLILSSLEGSLQQGHAAAFQLLALLADKAPVAFSNLAVESLPTLPVPRNHPDHLLAMPSWTEALVSASISTEAKQVSLLRTASPATNLDELIVEPDSRAAQVVAPCLLPVLDWIRSVSANPQQGLTESLQTCFQHLAHAAVTCPSLLAGKPEVLRDLIQTCLQISTAPPTQTEVRLAALQVLVSLVSVGDVKRRHLPTDLVSAIATSALPVCVQIMSSNVDVEETEQAWAEEPATLVQDGMEDEDEDDYLFAETLIQGFLTHVGAAALNVILPLTEKLLQSSNSQEARSGLAVLESALVSTPVSLTPHLTVLVQAATSLSTAASPRVQYHALRLLGTLCEIHPESVRASADASNAILPPFANALASPCSKVSAMASLGLVSYCRGNGEIVPADTLAPFLSTLLSALVQGPLSLSSVDTGSVTVRVRAMGATACLAEAAGEEFAAFYNDIMPGLAATAQLNVIELAGAAVESATIVGCAVGKDCFHADAQQLLSWILPALQTEATSAVFDQLLSACARIASVLEEDFAPYMSSVLPRLLQRAQQPPDVSVTEGDESGLGASESANGTESMTVAVPGRGFTKVTINTSKIQEKSHATRAVYEHAKAMGAAFGPYTETCLEAFLPLVTFAYSADVRSTSAQTVAAVFEAACLAGEDEAIGMSIPQKYLPMLAAAIFGQIPQEDPADMEAVYAMADSLSELYYVTYRYRNSHPDVLSNFSQAVAQDSVHSCIKSLVSCLERRAQTTRVLAGALTGEDEKEDYMEQLRTEEQLLTPLVDSIGYTLKFFGPTFVPLFESAVAPVLSQYLTNHADVRASISSLCLFDDLVEHCGSDAATRYAPTLLEGIMMAFEGNTDDRELVQAAVYGVAQITRNAPNAISTKHLPTIVHRLLSLTNCSKDEAGDRTYLVEIAASALASLALFGPFTDLKFAPRDTLLSNFMSQLPIQQDDDEAKICHAGFCHLVETGAVNLEQNAGRVTEIIGGILSDVEDGEDVATADTIERLSSILFGMQQNLPAPIMHQALSSLGAEAQNSVAAAMQGVALSRSHVITP